jgi:predicted permease
MSAFTGDLRFACRRLAHAPGFAVATVLMLALGIALSVGMFTVVRGVLLSALPYPDAARVVEVAADNPRQSLDGSQLTPAEAVALAGADGPFEAFGHYMWGGLAVFDDAQPREFSLAIVSPGFFPALGVAPALGRSFAAEDFEPGSDAVLLSHAEWQRLLGGDPAALGRRIDTSDGPMTVIGVMPAGFDYPADVVGAWRPLPNGRLAADQPWYRHARFIHAVARLKAGSDAGLLQQRLDQLAATVRAEFSLPDDGWRPAATPLLERIVGEVRPVLWSAFAIALLVLLIGCANVAILLDARQVAHAHEHAVAQALGASRGRLYRVLLLEIGVLALAAALLGSLLALRGVAVLRALAAEVLPRVEQIAVDPRDLLFALLLAVAVPFLAAAVGALRLRGAGSDAIRGAGRGLVGGRQRQRLLPTVGIALSTISLVAASALWFSLDRLQRVDPGFRADGVQALQVFRGGGPERARQLAGPMLEALAALPGVEQAALTTVAPLARHGGFRVDLQLQGRDQPEPFQIGLRRVSAGYLDLLGIPLLAGRGIEAGDGDGSEPVAVINQELARRLFGNGNAVDQRVGLPLGQGDRIVHRIVGVMADIRNDGLRAPPAPELLVAFDRLPFGGMTFLVRSATPLPGMAELMADALWQIDPREAISDQFALADNLAGETATVGFFARTIGLFALAALLLAALGVYAVAALQQQRRRGEFGLRLAIGARPAALMRQMLGDSARSVVAGVLPGLVGAWLALQLLQSQLYGLDNGPAPVIALGIAMLLAAALTAALLPAWRAGRIDPMQALRDRG